MTFKSVFTKSLFRIILITTLVEAFVLAVLQPFDINDMKSGKWLLISGCCLLNVVSIIISQILTINLCKLPFFAKRKKRWNDIMVNLFTIIFLPVMICEFNSYAFHGSLMWCWYDQNGNFYFDCLLFYIYCAIVMSFLAIVFLRILDWNKDLKCRLNEAVALNELLVKRMSMEHKEQTGEKEELVNIEGATKDSVQLNPKKFLFAESNGNYASITYISVTGVRKEMVRCTMKQLEDCFSGYSFIMRCHRAYIVNLSQVTHFEGNSKGFILSLNEVSQKIPVSRAYTQDVRKQVEAE